MDTKSTAIFEVNMHDKSVNFDLNNYDTDTASPLLSDAFVGIIDMLWLRDKFLKEMAEIMNSYK